MGFLREFVMLFIAGLVLTLTYLAANIIAFTAVGFLPLGFLGELSVWVAWFLILVMVGAVGRFGVKYMP